MLLRKQDSLEPDADQDDLEDESSEEEEEKLYCAPCGHLITKGTWRFSMGGDHHHTFFNPAGIIYELLCFKEAPGVFAYGTASDEFTWFKGYKWQTAYCTACSEHIGWRFVGPDSPGVFFTLIQSKLTNHKPG